VVYGRAEEERAMPFGSLWLPVLVSGAAVWIASAIVWMVLPHHRSDFKSLKDEPSVADALRKQGLPPGEYRVPYCSDMKAMKDPAFVKKLEDGPVALVVLTKPGPPAMGKSLGLYLAFTVFVSFVVAYIARLTLQPSSSGAEVFRLTGTVAIATYALGVIPESIWMGRPWPHTIKSVIDAAAYGLLTGAVFMLLWPKT
jgi:hypothetical protein